MKFVAYLRVSTAQQGLSGLGLEAQLKAVTVYAARLNAPVVDIYQEVESGKHDDRVELAKALAACRRRKATLLVAKLDRLSRNVAFLSALMESKVKFVACDNPEANELTIHILAAVAQAERQAISARTVAALGALKARGVALGFARSGAGAARAASAAGAGAGPRASARARSAAADSAAQDLAEVVRELRGSGATSLRLIGAALDARGEAAPRGGRWTAAAVSRLLGRIDAAKG